MFTKQEIVQILNALWNEHNKYQKLIECEITQEIRIAYERNIKELIEIIKKAETLKCS